MKKVFLIFTLILISLCIFSDARAQERKKYDLKPEEVKDKTTIPEIKRDKSATPELEEAKTRGPGATTCFLYLHNYTAYFIDAYVDGYWVGTVGPWDDMTVSTGSGYTSIYGISSARSVEWKTSGLNCSQHNDFNFTK